jgi:hypothetical protein
MASSRSSQNSHVWLRRKEICLVIPCKRNDGTHSLSALMLRSIKWHNLENLIPYSVLKSFRKNVGEVGGSLKVGGSSAIYMFGFIYMFAALRDAIALCG